MPELDYFIVAESLSTDRDRNTVSVFHIVEEWTGRLPAVIPKAVAISSWRVSKDEIGRDFQVALEIVLPDGKRVPEEPADLTVNFTAQSTGHRVYLGFQSLQLTCAGEMVFRILMNGKHVASRVVPVRERQDPD